MPETTPAAGAMASALDGYKVNALASIADSLGAMGEDKHTKANLVAKLAAFLGSEKHVNTIRKVLTPRQWRVLAMPRLRREPVSLRALHIRLMTMGADEYQASNDLSRLFQLGCLVDITDRSQQRFDFSYRTLNNPWIMHSQVISFPAVLDEAERQAPPVPVETAPEPAQISPASFADLQREIFVALHLAQEDAIKLTMAGPPYRASINKLAAETTGSGSGPRQKGGARAKRTAADPGIRPWFVLALLADPALTDQGESTMRPTAEAARLLASPLPAQAERLCRAWLDSPFDEFGQLKGLERDYGDRKSPWVDRNLGGFGDLPVYDRIRCARRSIVETLRHSRAGASGWTDIRAFAATMWGSDPEFLFSFQRMSGSSYWYYHSSDDWRHRPYEGIHRAGKNHWEGRLQKETDWEEVEGAFVAEVVAEPLHWLGLADLGLDKTGKPVSFRLSPLGCHVILGEPFETEVLPERAGPALVIQPNFEIIVMDANANLALLAQLDTFAVRKTLDRAAVYDLTRDALVRGMDRGLAGSAILALLERAAGGPLPQNVRYSIDEWVRLYERVQLRTSATLLEANSPQQMERWANDTVLGPMLARRIPPRMALVAAADLPKVQERLKRLGEPARHFDYSRANHHVLSVREPADIDVPVRYDEPYLRYRLGQIAELSGQDSKELHYRLTPESVRRAVESGLTGVDIAQYLAQRDEGTIPADTMVRIRGWSGGFPAFRYESVTAVETPPGVTWDDLLGITDIGQFILKRMNLETVLVASEDMERMRSALGERGIALKPGLVDETVGVGVARPADAGPGEKDIAIHVIGKDHPILLRLLRGTPRRIRRLTGYNLDAYLEEAISLRQPVVLSLLTADKTEMYTIMLPLIVGSDRDGAYLDGRCFACQKTHRLPFVTIKGVVPLPDSGLE